MIEDDSTFIALRNVRPGPPSFRVWNHYQARWYLVGDFQASSSEAAIALARIHLAQYEALLLAI